MNSTNLDPRDYIPLTNSVFSCLLALSDKPMHGYGIMKEVEAKTADKIPTGTLYRSINQMLNLGLIEKCNAPQNAGSEDARRQYYRITALGSKVVSAEALRLWQLLNVAKGKQLLPGNIAWG